MKEFNTTAVCVPSKHYMVDLSERVREIGQMVDTGKYFTINRARQYGKTTTLTALQKYLSKVYHVVSISFQGIGDAGFKTEQAFVKSFCRLIRREIRNGLTLPETIEKEINDYIERKQEWAQLDELFDTLLMWCHKSEKGIVLIIDEVDSATDSQAFLDFLAQLRDSYINRDTKGIRTFQSVILAGVTDVKHLKSRIRDEEQHKVNSPWNIAADFNIDMSLSEKGIMEMLHDYEEDHHTGMDLAFIARQIRDYTSGYPFLVSRICQLIDKDVCCKEDFDIHRAWTKEGMDEAIKLILLENNTLFQSLTGKLTNYPELKSALRSILMEGTRLTYNAQQESIFQMEMYGFICNDHNIVRISNRIFEMLLYNLFLSDEELKNINI